MLLFAPRIGDVLGAKTIASYHMTQSVLRSLLTRLCTWCCYKVGRVNFIGHDHVGLTVYDSFKVRAPRASTTGMPAADIDA